MNLSGLSQVGGAFQQAQAAQQEMQLRAMQIQQAQQGLDQEKAKLQSSAAAFKGLLGGDTPGGGIGAQQPRVQPPMPGAPSIPMQQPGARPQGAAPGPSGPVVPAGGPPQGPAAPPATAQPPGGGPVIPGSPPAGQQPGGGQQVQPAMQILQGIAKQIAQQNPGLDPSTAMDAVKQQVEMMRGVEPDVKNQVAVLADSMKMQIQLMKAQSSEEMAKIRQDYLERSLADRRDTAVARDDTTRRGQDLRAAGGPKFTDDEGALMAAMAERGVSLPTGFRSKEQQAQLYKSLLERNSGKTPDEIADGIAKGQIGFGAQKKETQTAAGQAGKVEVAQNELSEFIPLVKQASAAVPRGKFMPINKLLQTADNQLSDPALRALKIRINSTLNAYDQLAARGGTDKNKRAEAHALLTTADSPEVLDAALQSFAMEAAAAKRAAVKATKVPELADDPGAEPAAGGGNVIRYDAQGNRIQ